ncbi:hypothetical protein FGB62_26g011 [Gracilaria domingensis]|nr:hypothetical protein FGB62_26g011 [Gracilaria domingensis]
MANLMMESEDFPVRTDACSDGAEAVGLPGMRVCGFGQNARALTVVISAATAMKKTRTVRIRALEIIVKNDRSNGIKARECLRTGSELVADADGEEVGGGIDGGLL